MSDSQSTIGSQGLPKVEDSATNKAEAERALAGNPKATEHGTIKDPQTGSTLAASANNPQASRFTGSGPNISPNPVANKPSPPAKTPTEAISGTKSSAVDPAKAAGGTKDSASLEKSFTEVSGEILQGDSFRLTLVRDGVTIRIPVPMETTRDLYALDNTFKIVSAVLAAKNRAELHEKFESFIGE